MSGVLCGFGLTLGTSRASALDAQVESTTLAQGYEVASPWGASLVRRRLVQQAGFSLFQRGEDDGPVVAARVLVRFDADVGLDSHLPLDRRGAETSAAIAEGAHFVPGLAPASTDVVFAYVDVDRLAGGWLGVRAGRQVVSDVLGWWSFDGLRVRASSPVFVRFEAYGGLEQRGGLPLSTPRYERPGVWRGAAVREIDRGAARTAYPSYLDAGLAPAFGASLATLGLDFVDAGVEYRRVENTAPAALSPFARAGETVAVFDEARTSSERLALAAAVSEATLGAVRGSLVHDLLLERPTRITGRIEGYVSPTVTLGLDAEHDYPSFDGDSIWNWFAREASTLAVARGEVQLTRKIDLSMRAGTKAWALVTEGEVDSARGSIAEKPEIDSIAADALVDTIARYRGGLADAVARSMIQAGARGHRVGVEVSGERRLDGGRFALGGRVSWFDTGYDDELYDRGGLESDRTTLAYALGVGFQPLRSTQLGVEWDHAHSERVGHRLRLFASLALRWGG